MKVSVTKCSRAEVALKVLRDDKDGYDVVISDVYMPGMDGFELLEHIGLEMDLPVILMWADGRKNVVMKGITHGACDYLMKPVRMEALKNIWQHVEVGAGPGQLRRCAFIFSGFFPIAHPHTPRTAPEWKGHHFPSFHNMLIPTTLPICRIPGLDWMPFPATSSNFPSFHNL